ncbi:hypothetical protein [Alteromonas mediterranea]|uniref:hypothetical protein n=1 Tax=Alteromonas mediterranea TaxID=314275 RepID=UPI002FDF5EBC
MNSRIALLAFNILGGAILSFTAFIAGSGSASPVVLLYWGILPGLPFLVLAFLGASNKKLSQRSLLFMSLAALLVTLVIYGQAFVYIGGGANIGAGLMIIYSPIAYIGAISIGWAIGELFCSMPREH